MPDEALGMSRVGGVQRHLTMSQDLSRVAVVDHGRRHQAKTRVMMLVVVPLEKGLAKPARVFDRTETIRETRPVFQGAELAFRVRIVVGDVRAAVGFDDAQIGEQQSHGFRFHRRGAIGMDRELTRRDVLRVTGMLDEPLGQLGTFAMRDHPPDHETAENIEDDVEVIRSPFHRAAQLGNVPTPQLIGFGGQQLRLLIRRMSELIAALAAFAMRFQQAVHGANRAMKPAFIEQRRVDLRGRAILKTLLMKAGKHGGLFECGQCADTTALSFF